MKIAALSHLGDRLREYNAERPKLCGVYLLVLDDDVVYVGQSTDLHTRIAIQRSCYHFDRVFWIEVPAEKLDEYEGALIRRLAPRANRKHTVSQPTDAAIVAELDLPLAPRGERAAMTRRRNQSYRSARSRARARQGAGQSGGAES